MLRSTSLLLAGGAAAVAFAALVAAPQDASARGRRRAPIEISNLHVASGDPDMASGRPVVLQFRLWAPRKRMVPVNFRFATDLNGDGEVEDGEFADATIDAYAPGSTGRRNRRGGLRYEAGPEGRVHAAIWRASADGDLATTRHVVASPLRDDRGVVLTLNPVGDPILVDDPADLTGVVVRASVTKKILAETEELSFDGGRAPVVEMQSAAPGAQTTITYVASDADDEPIQARFFFTGLPEGADLATMTDIELRALPWTECTGVPPRGAFATDVSASPAGVEHTFLWDTEADIPNARFQWIVGGVGIDGHEAVGAFHTLRTVVDFGE